MRKVKPKEASNSSWIDELRQAFADADSSGSRSLTMEQWLSSKLNTLVANDILDNKQMMDFFNCVDTNCDSKISWDDLVEYLLTHGNSFRLQASSDKKMKVTFEAPDEKIMRKTYRTARIRKMLHLEAQGRIVTLSDSTFTVWKSSDCVLVHSVTDKDGFVDCCVVPSMAKIAVAKPNRRIVFLDIRNFEPMKMVISGSAVESDVPKMTEEESERAVTTGKASDLPLFNKPKAIIGHPELNVLFVGDEEGRVEVFRMFMTRNARHGWAWERLNVRTVHHDAITQISYLPDKDVYVSSSLDGSIVIWKYKAAENAFQKVYRFRNTEKLAITSFAYDSQTSDIVYVTTAHYFGVWRTFTEQYEHIETPSQVVVTLAIVQLSSEASFCVTISKDNFVSIYRMPNLVQLSNYYMGLQHALCPPTYALAVKYHLYLGGAFLSMWRCDDCTSEGLSAHASPIVSAIRNEMFDKVISVDRGGDLHIWDIENGNKVFSASIKQGDSEVRCMALDTIQRRLGVGYSDGLCHIVAANSGTVLSVIDRSYFDGGCNAVVFGTVLNTSRIICLSNNKIVMFEDMSGNRVNFIRKFVEHSEDVSKVLILKEKYMLSIGSGSEMFLWNVSQQHPILKYHLDVDPSTALDIPDDPDKFLVGDVAGNIHMMSISSPSVVGSIAGFGLVTKSSVTIMSMHKDQLIAGNMHGYIKVYKHIGEDFRDVVRFRAHTEAIISISVSETHGVVITAGRDEEIRIWRLEPFALVGELGKLSRWNISTPSSYQSTTPLPDDPNHFVDLSVKHNTPPKDEPVQHTSNLSDTSEEIQVPPFSFADFSTAINDIENLCYTGRKYVRLAESKPDNVPLTSRPVPPPSLVNTKMMTRTLKLFKQIKAKPKLWKPTIP